eukprot:6201193-Pleurochrysis_carterae.AAC.1
MAPGPNHTTSEAAQQGPLCLLARCVQERKPSRAVDRSVKERNELSFGNSGNVGAGSSQGQGVGVRIVESD